MKTRNGFVSNSSSSSFVFIGFPASHIRGFEDSETAVKRLLTMREIDAEAVDFFENDDAGYSEYRNGKADPDFWKHVYRTKCRDEIWNAPEGLQCCTIEDGAWYGKKIATVEYGTVPVDMNKVTETLIQLKSKFQVQPTVYLGHSE